MKLTIDDEKVGAKGATLLLVGMACVLAHLFFEGFTRLFDRAPTLLELGVLIMVIGAAMIGVAVAVAIRGES